MVEANMSIIKRLVEQVPTKDNLRVLTGHFPPFHSKQGWLPSYAQCTQFLME